MCTITLSYDNSNAQAREKLADLLSTGLFDEIASASSPDYDEVMEAARQRVMQKENYTLEEACELTLNEIKSVYQVEYAL